MHLFDLERTDEVVDDDEATEIMVRLDELEQLDNDTTEHIDLHDDEVEHDELDVLEASLNDEIDDYEYHLIYLEICNDMLDEVLENDIIDEVVRIVDDELHDKPEALVEADEGPLLMVDEHELNEYLLHAIQQLVDTM